MDKKTKKWLAIVGITVVAGVVLILALLGFDLSELEIHFHKNITIN